MTYALKIRSSTKGAGEQEITTNPEELVKLASMEEDTHKFIMKYFKTHWKILEAGCGMGRWMIYLNDLGYLMHGMDISARAIEKLKSLKPNLNLKVGDITKMPYEDGEFDAVFSDGVIEHDPEGPEKMLSEMNRVLKSEGIMIVIVPVENFLRRFLHRPLCAIRYFILRRAGRKLEFEEFRFSVSDIANRVKKSGFEILELSHVELTDRSKSYSLCVDWGNIFKRKEGNEPFALNPPGMFIKRILASISPWIIAEGVVIAARKLD
ncbi:MAG: class I SAM-dependent methyltransferase [bacterium]